MLLMSKEMNKEQGDTEPTLYLPGQAVQYLREKRGIVMSVPALRQRRKRKLMAGHAMQDPRRVFDRTSLWTREELDAIEILRTTKRVKPDSEKA